MATTFDQRLQRALLAEFLGTLGFALFFGLSTASGAAYAVFVYATQHVSGGHLNPALTLATAITGHFHWLTAALYAVAQVLGAVFGGLLQAALIPAVHLGRRGLSPGCFSAPHRLSDFGIFGWELVLTFALVWVLYAVGIAKPGHGSLGPLALGLTVYAANAVGGHYSGAALNPALILKNALVFNCNALGSWVWIGGQTIGAALAAAFAGLLFGFGGAYTNTADDGSANVAEDPARQPLTGEQHV